MAGRVTRLTALLSREAARYVTSDYTPRPEVLARLRELNPNYDLRWDARKQQWGLWERRKLDGEPFWVFLGHFGPYCDGRIVQRAKARIDFLASELPETDTTADVPLDTERIAHAVYCDDDWTARQRVEETRQAIRRGEA